MKAPSNKPPIKFTQEQNPNFDPFRERLDLFVGKISQSVMESLGVPQQKFVTEFNNMQELVRAGGKSAKFDFYEKYCKKVVELLDNKGIELASEKEFKEYIAEFNALVESLKILFAHQGIKKYKSIEVEENKELTSDFINKQLRLRQDLTEGTALLKWHILQNESNLEYLNTFAKSCHKLASLFGMGKELDGVIRGVNQELGVYKILKKYFKEINFSTPKEDAKYKIDFFGETYSGRKIIIQTKSSIPVTTYRGEYMKRIEGVFNETWINKMVLSEKNKPRKFYGNERDLISPKSAMQSLQDDMEIAKKYSQSKNLGDIKFYLVVASADHFSNSFNFLRDRPKSVRFLDKALKSLAQN